MTTPTIGRIVHVPMHPSQNNGSAVAPAVITRVWSDTMINVRILADGLDTPWRTSIELVDELPEREPGDESAPPAVWIWPPRV